MRKRMEILPNVFLSATQTDKFKTGTCSISFLRPLTDLEASCDGLIMRVLLQGSKRCPDMRSMSLALDALYGSELSDVVRKKGEVLTIGLLADYIEDQFVSDTVFANVIDLMAEVLLDPVLENGAFRSEYVEREKENVCNELCARINSKRTYAVTQMIRAMCSGEAYSVDKFGSEETVSRQTAQSLYAHYLQMLSSSRIEICYLGRLDADTVAEQLRKSFAALPRGEVVSVSTEPNPAVGSVREVSESLDVTQGKLCMGFRISKTANDPDWASVLLMNTVYGSGVTSKLFLNVREKLSLCYYAASALEKFKGIMLVDSGVDFSNFDAAKSEILHQLEDCKSGNITEEELALARKNLISRWKSALDSPGQIDEFYLGQAILGSESTMEDMIERIECVTMDDVVSAANCLTLDTVYFLKGTNA
ncbi:MAG: insulinase family protein [Oscillospiraceae bacterium]|nr:insulinase family protein [Oscillospiraceae bacterium]